MLQVDGAVVHAVQAGVGGDADAQAVQLASQVIAHIEGQAFAGVGAVHGELHLVAVAYQALGDAGGDPVGAPVGDQNGAAELHFAAQHLPGVHHLQLARFFVRGAIGFGAGGDDHYVGALGFYQRAVDAGVAAHFDASQLHLALQVGGGTAELRAARQELGEVDLAAQLSGGFAKDDVMATLGSDSGGLHAGWPTTDHQDAFALGGHLAFGVDQFAAGFRMLDAGDRVAAVEVADACLVAGDAGAHVLDVAAFGLAGHLRVADQRAGHAADIGLATGDDQLGFLRLVDAPGDEQRDVQIALEGAGFVGQVGRFDGHRRHDVDGAAQGGGGAGDDVHVVQVFLQPFDALQRFVFGEAFGIAFVGGDAQADDEVLVGGGADGGDHFAGEAQAGVEIAVVAVAAAVHPWVEELRRQVAVAGHHFHAVDAGSVQAPCGGSVACDDLVDHRLAQLAGHHAEAFVGRGGRRVGHGQQAVAGFHDFAARVEHLGQHHRALGVARLGNAPVAGDALVIGGHQHVGGVAGAVVHAGDLQHDQADAALGAGGVIGHQLVVDQVVGGHRGVVPGGHDAVLQRLAADLQRAEQVGKLAHRATPDSCCKYSTKHRPRELERNKAETGEAAEFTPVNEHAEPVSNAVAPTRSRSIS